MDEAMIKIIIRTLIITVLILFIMLTTFSVAMANYLSTPRGLSLNEEKEWAISHGVWGELENYNTKEYTVKGKDDYVLHCEFVQNDNTKDTGKYVIISHGYNSNRYGAAKYVPVYIDLGYSCIIYDLRGHGENEKSVCTIGNYEAEDLAKVIDDTYERYGDDIFLGLHGESMGSSTSLSVMRYSPNVKFVVADCGFTNLYELIGNEFRSSHIAFSEPCVDLALRVIYGYSMKDTSAIDAVNGCTVPVCFIHGKNDTFITPDNSERLRECVVGYSELHLIDGAEHAQSREVLGISAYEEIVSDFLDVVYKK